jgi:hypothetical protein
MDESMEKEEHGRAEYEEVQCRSRETGGTAAAQGSAMISAFPDANESQRVIMFELIFAAYDEADAPASVELLMEMKEILNIPSLCVVDMDDPYFYGPDDFRVKVFVMKNNDFISQTIEYRYSVDWRMGPSVFRHFEDHFRREADDNTLSLWRFGETSEDETLNSLTQKLPPRSEDIGALVAVHSRSLERIGKKNFGGDSDRDLQEESCDLEVYVNWCRRKYMDENTAFFWAYPTKTAR